MRKVPIEEVRRQRGFYSKRFWVPKPDDGWRPIIDWRWLNKYIKEKPSRWVL